MGNNTGNVYLIAIVAAVAVISMAVMVIDYRSENVGNTMQISESADALSSDSSGLAMATVADSTSTSSVSQLSDTQRLQSSCSVVLRANGRSSTVTLSEGQSTYFAGKTVRVDSVYRSDGCTISVNGVPQDISQNAPALSGGMTVSVRSVSLQ